MDLTSSAFKEGGEIPSRFTCDGENLSPVLSWSGAPAQARGLVLLVEDPDAPGGTFVHWLMYHIPAKDGSLPEGVPAKATLPDGAMQGRNDFGKIGYSGPCPPSGVHRYFFRLYALDLHLQTRGGVERTEVDREMKGHVVAQAALLGRYRRHKG